MQSVDLTSSRNSLCGYLTPALVWDHCPQPGQCCSQSCCLPFSSCSQCSFPAATPALCFVSMFPGIMGLLLFSFKLSKACGGSGLLCADNSCMEQYSAKSFPLFLPVGF